MTPDNRDSLHLFVDVRGSRKSGNETVSVAGPGWGLAEQEAQKAVADIASFNLDFHLLGVGTHNPILQVQKVNSLG